MWIHVESKEDQPNPEVTACRPDSETPPFFKPRKAKVTRESAQQARDRMRPTEAPDQDPNNGMEIINADDIPF